MFHGEHVLDHAVVLDVFALGFPLDCVEGFGLELRHDQHEMRIMLQVGGAFDGIFAVIELLPFHLRLNLEFDGCFREECGSAEEC